MKRTKEEDDKMLDGLGYPPLSQENFKRVSDLMDRREILLEGGREDEATACLIEAESIYRQHQASCDSSKVVKTAATLAGKPGNLKPDDVSTAGPAPAAIVVSPQTSTAPPETKKSCSDQYKDLAARERRGECSRGSASRFYAAHKKEITDEQVRASGGKRTPAGNVLRT